VLGVKVKEDETRVAFSTLLPSISLAGSYSGGSTRYSAFQSITRGWAAQLTGGWDIFDGTINWNKVKEANANLDSARAKELDMQRVVALEVKDANFQLESAKVNVDEAKKAVLLAEENNKIAEMRYNAGAGNSLEVIDAQVELTRARYNLVEVQYSLQVAKAKVNRTVGTDVYSRFQKTGGVS
jgi:outer membrane protein TolC